LVLVGMMGAGKTAVGRVLAHDLSRPFADADVEVEVEAGRTIPEVFEHDGEAAFRDLEARVLCRLLGRRPPAVVATGGGVVERRENRRLLRERAVVVWLRAPVDELLERVGGGRGRPLLAQDPAGVLEHLAAQRQPWYAEVADVVVDTGRRSPGAVAGDVARRLAGLAPAGAGGTTS
jgi:shikimate kinase